jgi:hypothetical protein
MDYDAALLGKETDLVRPATFDFGLSSKYQNDSRKMNPEEGPNMR